MSTPVEKFRDKLVRVIGDFGKVEFQRSLDACNLSHLPIIEPPEPTEEELEELAKGPSPNYAFGARISQEERREAKRVPGRVIHQGIIKEVRDRLW